MHGGGRRDSLDIQDFIDSLGFEILIPAMPGVVVLMQMIYSNRFSRIVLRFWKKEIKASKQKGVITLGQNFHHTCSISIRVLIMMVGFRRTSS